MELNSMKCFIITPIGSEKTEVRDSLDGLMQNVIEPVLTELGFLKDNISVAHQIYEGGSINNQIVKRIIEDDINIVNLTGLNPNVMYELAIRHAVGKPVIIISEESTKPPFDIIDQRTIFYKDTMLGAVNLKDKLKKMIQEIIDNPDKEVDNPVLKIIRENSVIEKVQKTEEGENGYGLILNKIIELERNMEKIAYRTFEKNPITHYYTLVFDGNINEEEITQKIYAYIGKYGIEIFDIKKISPTIVSVTIRLSKPIPKEARRTLFNVFDTGSYILSEIS